MTATAVGLEGFKPKEPELESHSLSQLLPNSSRYYQINGSDWRRMAYGDW